jgi:ATP-dependent phosphoenolpyruvate carboxykinase
MKESQEPEIYRAIKFGAVVENVLFHDGNKREVQFIFI